MAYIGSIPAYQAAGVRPRDEFVGDGTQTCFALSQTVPGSFESNVTIVVDNVPQQPVESFTIVDTKTLTLTSITGTFSVNETVTGGTSSATGTVIKVNLNNIVVKQATGTFSNSETITGGTSSATATTTAVDTNTGAGVLFSEAPLSASVIYVVHEGNATYNLVPVAGSVGPTQLSENLRNFTVDTFTGDGTTTSFTLSAEPASANSILVFVQGIMQTRTDNYTLSGSVVTFTSAPDSSAAISVVHLGFTSVSRVAVPDGSITTSKLADNSVTPIKLSTGGPAWDTSGNTTVDGNVTISGSTRRITGDFSNTTHVNRILFQSTTTNGNTSIGAVPNGAAVNSNFVAYGAPDPTNAPFVQMVMNGTEGQFRVGKLGTGTVMPMTFVTNDVERARIDTSGNVLFGTTSVSPSNANSVYVYPSDSTVRFTNTTANGKEWTVGTSSPGVSGAGNYFAVTNYSGSAWAQYMKVDGSGRVTKPYQPSFLAAIPSGADATYTSGQFLAFGTCPTNIGNHFNTSTYKFTVPVSGVYWFSYSMLFTNSSGNTQSMQAAINVNGSYPTPVGGDAYSILACTPNSLGGNIQLTSTVLFNLSAGDVVGVTNRSANNLRIYQGHTFFAGYLLG